MKQKPSTTQLVVRAPVDFVTRMIYYTKGIYHYVDKHPIYLLSAGIAFNVLLCAMPLMFLITYGLGKLIEWDALLLVIEIQLRQFIPDPASRASLMDTVRGQVNAVLQGGQLAGIAGLFGALWTSTALFSALRTALNGIYGMRAVKFFALYKLYDLLFLALLGVLVVVGNFSGPVYALLHQLGASYFPQTFEAILEQLASVAVGAISTFALFFLLYRYLAHKPVPALSALVGAAAATILWECAKFLFGYYLTRFHSLGVLYGAYTFVVVTAIWLYYSALVFVVGAILTKLHWDEQGME